MSDYILYSSVIIIIFAFFIQFRIFVTPEQLEKKHKEILHDVEERFAQKETVKLLRDDVRDMKEKINSIYEFLIRSHG